ncbi:Cupin-type protein [Gaiella occulta]|uniref:Cupin-type protein n=1 Tax=Gaiella occulta TaxID=1002870 RepID=A0A7M2YU88_9ACTN|nr:cupin domain-containing protein [Gaiella occulta]RDI73636.1 Cupin-type protein [Gaiella occulta]
MSNVMAPCKTHVDTTDYEPFNGFEAVLEGDPDAKVAWLRTESGGEGVLYTGMFTAEPSTFRYVFGGDESFHVLDGDLDIAVDGGDTVTLAPGDIASFPKGATSTWALRAPLRKFFVISG